VRTPVCVTLVCVMGLLAGAGCGTDRTAGGYRVAILPRVAAPPEVRAPAEAPAAEPPEEWALEFILWKSNLLGSSFYTADREAKRRFGIKKHVARPQSREANVFDVPAFSHDEGVRVGLLTGFGWERKADVRLYALGFEWAEPDFNLFYDREEMKGHHERMTAALRAATTAEARAYVLEQNVRRCTPAVLSPYGPGTVGVAFVPWSCSTEQFPRFWELISSPDAFDAALARWKRWRWSGSHREAVRRIMAWHVARYDAAVAERPELTRQSVPATNIARLRKRLGK